MIDRPSRSSTITTKPTPRTARAWRTTHHHHYSIYSLILPKSFPELEIKPSGFFSKLGQAFGFDDIDFESVEFSKRYQVKCGDKKFAYDIRNALMIDWLLGQQRQPRRTGRYRETTGRRP